MCLWFFCHCGNGPKTVLEISFQELKKYETKLLQLDGNIDLSSDSDTCEEKSAVDLPKEVGLLSCIDEDLFHILTLCRGFEVIWPQYEDHKICDNKKTEAMCMMCLVRSFTLRINHLKPKAQKTVVPTEVYSAMMDVVKQTRIGSGIAEKVDFFFKEHVSSV